MISNNIDEGEMMTGTYYFNKILRSGFEDALLKVTQALAKEGFGIITEIDVKATFKKKLDVDFRNYMILGACSPRHAYRALQSEDKVGTMLPCNVIVQETGMNQIEVAAIDPIASMAAIKNPALGDLAKEIQDKLKKVIDSL